MKSLRFFCLFGALLGLIACGGAEPSSDNSGNPPPVDSPQNGGEGSFDNPSGGLRGSFLKPLRVEISAEMRAFSFYDISGFRICEVGVSPNDKIKKSLFVNLAGPGEACAVNPKRALTLVLRKPNIDKLGLQLSAGMSVERGVILPQRDVGNARLVAFATEFIEKGKLTFRP